MFLKIEKHKRDRSDKKNYYVWLDGPGAVDQFVKTFLFDNRVYIGVKNRKLCWITKKGGFKWKKKTSRRRPAIMTR